MPKPVETFATPTNPMQPLAAGIVELDEASIAAVAGGINPQPLPPERHSRLD